MKPISDALRRKIEDLRKTHGNAAAPTWILELYRDREKMLGIIDGERITSGSPIDVQPTVAHDSGGVYDVLFGRGGTVYSIRSSATNYPDISWGPPAALFAGAKPDIDFDGSFATTGKFTSGDLLCVYEEPAGTILFRRRSEADGSWSAPVTVGSGTDASIVRAWADPPEVGTQDEGFVVFYTLSDQLHYRQSVDGGASWSDAITFDTPAGGIKRNPQVFRLADYTLGICYEYDNGLSADVYFLKTGRTYVNLASPDETVTAGAGAYRHFEFVVVNLTAPDETVVAGAGAYAHAVFQNSPKDAPGETATAGAGAYRHVTFTGTSP